MPRGRNEIGQSGRSRLDKHARRTLPGVRTPAGALVTRPSHLTPLDFSKFKMASASMTMAAAPAVRSTRCVTVETRVLRPTRGGRLYRQTPLSRCIIAEGFPSRTRARVLGARRERARREHLRRGTVAASTFPIARGRLAHAGPSQRTSRPAYRIISFDARISPTRRAGAPRRARRGVQSAGPPRRAGSRRRTRENESPSSFRVRRPRRRARVVGVARVSGPSADRATSGIATASVRTRPGCPPPATRDALPRLSR